MSDYGWQIVIDADFETSIGSLCRAIRDEELQVLARSDVREHFWKHLSRDFRPYTVIEVWSPDSAFFALRQDPDLGSLLPARFVAYEGFDGSTVVVATKPLAPLADDVAWRERAPALAAVADRERERIERVLERAAAIGREPTRLSAERPHIECGERSGGFN